MRGDTPAELTQRANHQLVEENRALRKALNQRAADVAIQVTEGLSVLLSEAAGGNAAAKGVLDLFVARIDEARALRAGLALVRDTAPIVRG